MHAHRLVGHCRGRSSRRRRRRGVWALTLLLHLQQLLLQALLRKLLPGFCLPELLVQAELAVMQRRLDEQWGQAETWKKHAEESLEQQHPGGGASLRSPPWLLRLAGWLAGRLAGWLLRLISQGGASSDDPVLPRPLAASAAPAGQAGLEAQRGAAPPSSTALSSPTAPPWHSATQLLVGGRQGGAVGGQKSVKLKGQNHPPTHPPTHTGTWVYAHSPTERPLPPTDPPRSPSPTLTHTHPPTQPTHAHTRRPRRHLGLPDSLPERCLPPH